MCWLELAHMFLPQYTLCVYMIIKSAQTRLNCLTYAENLLKYSHCWPSWLYSYAQLIILVLTFQGHKERSHLGEKY